VACYGQNQGSIRISTSAPCWLARHGLAVSLNMTVCFENREVCMASHLNV